MILSQHFSGESEEESKNSHRDYKCPGYDKNPGPQEHELCVLITQPRHSTGITRIVRYWVILTDKIIDWTYCQERKDFTPFYYEPTCDIRETRCPINRHSLEFKKHKMRLEDNIHMDIRVMNGLEVDCSASEMCTTSGFHSIGFSNIDFGILSSRTGKVQM
jgi:hypothetical protein